MIFTTFSFKNKIRRNLFKVLMFVAKCRNNDVAANFISVTVLHHSQLNFATLFAITPEPSASFAVNVLPLIE